MWVSAKATTIAITFVMMYREIRLLRYNNAPGMPVAFRPRMEARKLPAPSPIIDMMKGLPSRRVTPKTAGSVIPRGGECGAGDLLHLDTPAPDDHSQNDPLYLIEDGANDEQGQNASWVRRPQSLINKPVATSAEPMGTNASPKTRAARGKVLPSFFTGASRSAPVKKEGDKGGLAS